MAESQVKAAGGLGDKAGAEATPPKPKKQTKAAPKKETPVAPQAAKEVAAPQKAAPPQEPQRYVRKVQGGGAVL